MTTPLTPSQMHLLRGAQARGGLNGREEGLSGGRMPRTVYLALVNRGLIRFEIAAGFRYVLTEKGRAA